jgi:hypothetical protein
VKEQLQRLEEVQAIDLRIRELTKTRNTIPSRIAELLEDSRAREAELAVIDARIAEIERERRMLEQNAREYHEKLQKAQAIQSEIKNQKEYEALLREIDGYRKHKNHFEEEVLRSMEILEEIGRTRAATAEAAAQSRQAADGEVRALEAKMAEINAQIRQEEAARSELAADLPPGLLKRYDTIRERRLGLAVVRALGGVCGGCNMNLPPQLYNVIMRLRSIETCPSCHRILYYRPPEPQA